MQVQQNCDALGGRRVKDPLQQLALRQPSHVFLHDIDIQEGCLQPTRDPLQAEGQAHGIEAVRGKKFHELLDGPYGQPVRHIQLGFEAIPDKVREK